MITMVVATDKNGIIGREDRVPWRLRADLINVRNLTKDRPVIMGRKTWDSMVWYYTKSGKQMPGKVYIVVTRDETYVPTFGNAAVAHSIPEAIKLAQREQVDDIVVLGGSSIYRAMLPYTDRIYLTQVHAEVPGDTYLPDLDPAEWQEVSREPHTKDEKNEYDFDFVILDRK